MGQKLPISVSAMECDESRTLYNSGYLLLLCVSGKGSMNSANEISFSEGDLLFVSPLFPGKIQLSKGCSVLYGVIDGDFFEDMIGVPGAQYLRLEGYQGDQVKEQLIAYFDLKYSETRGNFLDTMGAGYDLLRHLRPLVTETPAYVPKASEEDSRISRIIAYIGEHFRQPIQLEQLAAEFGASRQHISTYLHRELGMSFTNYLKNLRLEESLRLLLTTEKRITEISEESGFPNLRSFNTAFREHYGMAPREYRKSRQQTALGLSDHPETKVLKNINQLLTPHRMVYSHSAQQISLRDQVLCGKGEPFRDVWRDILNVDDSTDCLLSSNLSAIKSIQENFHFRYIRLGRVFSQELVVYIATKQKHRFTKLFEVLDAFRQMDLRPMLALGDTYKVTADAIMLEDGGYSVAPRDYLEMLEALLERAIHYWGRSWVSSWRFEFHMPKYLYGQENNQGFLDLFSQCASLLRRKIPKVEIGGPSMAMDSTHLSRWQDWFQGVTERKIPIDFVSVELWGDYTLREETYLGKDRDPRGALTVEKLERADGDLVLQKLNSIRTMMEEAGLNAKLYVSALGVTKYQATAAQIGGHCGAYLTRTILALGDQVDGLGCWKAINREQEYPEEDSVFGSGCGLYSRYGLKNPNYYAYEFLSNLLPRRVYQGLHCLVTADSQGRYAILIHNCRDYSRYFYKNYLNEKSLNFSESRQYDDYSALHQTLVLKHIPQGSYLVQQYLIGDHHGCIASVLEKLGVYPHLSPRDTAYVSGQSMPYQHNYRLYSQGETSITITLQPNEVMLLMLVHEDNETDHFDPLDS